MAQQMSDRELNLLLDAFLDRLGEAASKRSLTDAEAFSVLSHDEATMMFAESRPCWQGGGPVKLLEEVEP